MCTAVVKCPIHSFVNSRRTVNRSYYQGVVQALAIVLSCMADIANNYYDRSFVI